MKSRRTMADNEQIRFGRYRILDELGRGAMGVVYRALDPQINREVAIKTISLSGLNAGEEREYRSRFYREAEAAGRISHPGIVTIFDVGVEEETRAPFIVMELVSGGSLEDFLLGQDRKLNVEPALRLAVEIAEALDCAHGHGVVHRDLKPANILLTEEGRGKIADFGIAKLNLTNLTLAGSAIGTPSYMSPEQLNGEAVDGRSDLFSLGAVLYTVLTGYKPFQGNSVFTVSFKVVNRDPVPATVLNSQLPPGLDHIIGRAMSKDPAARYQSGEEMAKDIRALLGGHSEVDDTIPTYVRRRSPGATAGETVPSAHIAQRHLENGHLGATLLAGAVFLTGLCLYEARTIVFPLRAARPVNTQEHSAKSDTGKKASPAMDSLRSLNVSPQTSGVFYQKTATAESTTEEKFSASQTAPVAVSRPKKFPTAAVKKTSKVLAADPLIAPELIPSPTISEISQAIVGIEVQHSFSSGTLSIWVDSKLAFSHSLEGINKKHLVLFNRVEGHEFYSMYLPSGNHLLRVEVTSGQGRNNQSASIAGTVNGRDGTLLVSFDKHGKLTVSLR